MSSLLAWSSTDEASPDEIAEMARQEVTVNAPDVELLFRVTVDAYCFRATFPVRKEEATRFDGFGIVARNNGNALARHIQGTIELPSGVFVDYLKQVDLKDQDPIVAIAKTKSIKLEFSNYMRQPTSYYLARPNPLEWKPLLPGRELELFSEKTLPLGALSRDEARKVG